MGKERAKGEWGESRCGHGSCESLESREGSLEGEELGEMEADTGKLRGPSARRRLSACWVTGGSSAGARRD